MDLKAKLARLSPPRAPMIQAPPAPEPLVGEPEGSPRDAQLRSRLQELAERRRRPAPRGAMSAGLPGAPLATAAGEAHVVEQVLALSHRQGAMELARAHAAAADLLAKLALDESLACLDFRRALFIDTETTGLNGGAGTLPFLIGMAWFDDLHGLRVQQLLLRRPGEEAPMLALLTERMAAASCVVTYNGKSFDWPLLRTRFVLNRMPVPALAAHLDLLHCARRVFKRRVAEVRLSELEREVLGFTRIDDVSGAQIPELYLAFLRGAGGEILRPVIEHNAHDLVSLAALLGALADKMNAVHEDDDPRDRLGLAEVAARAGDVARAEAFARVVARVDGDAEAQADALIMLAGMQARRGEARLAADTFEHALTLCADRSERAAEIRLRLAKIYEHRLRDYERALEHARIVADERRTERLRRKVKKE